MMAEVRIDCSNFHMSSPPPSPSVYQIQPQDDVAAALRDLRARERIAVGDRTVEIVEPVARGHKVALRSIRPRRHAQRDLDSLHRRLRRTDCPAHRPHCLAAIRRPCR
jgi:hypothetical protein